MKLNYGNNSFLFTGDAETDEENADVKLYRTDLQGDIIAVSDGNNITFTTSR